MATRLYGSRYKDQEAVTLETPALRAQFVRTGAKICSLVHEAVELLVQRPGDHYRVSPFGSSFVEGERSGFDDLLPTIDSCFCEQEPWSGVAMADHGEVWSLPWDLAVDGDSLHFAVHGVRFPYRLEKAARFLDDRTLRLDYRLQNLSPFPFDFIWAAHPDLVLPPGAQLALPAGARELVLTWCPTGGYGTTLGWPLAGGLGEKPGKYYVKGRMPEGWCELRYAPGFAPRHPGGFVLRLDWPVDRVPHFAFLPNLPGGEIFLEPCTAPFDRPDLARLRGEPSVLGPRATLAWHLELTVRPHDGGTTPL